MIIFVKSLIKIAYVIFCIICTAIVVFHTAIILLNSLFINFDLQVFLFTVLSLLLIAGFWSLLFTKIHVKYKISIFVLLLCIQLNYMELSFMLPTIRKIIEMNTCVDTGICN